MGGQSKLWVFLSCCRLLGEKEEDEQVEDEQAEDEQAEESRRGRLGLEQISTWSEASSEETLRNRRWRSGVCCGV